MAPPITNAALPAPPLELDRIKLEPAPVTSTWLDRLLFGPATTMAPSTLTNPPLLMMTELPELLTVTEPLEAIASILITAPAPATVKTLLPLPKDKLRILVTNTPELTVNALLSAAPLPMVKLLPPKFQNPVPAAPFWELTVAVTLEMPLPITTLLVVMSWPPELSQITPFVPNQFSGPVLLRIALPPVAAPRTKSAPEPSVRLVTLSCTLPEPAALVMTSHAWPLLPFDNTNRPANAVGLKSRMFV